MNILRDLGLWLWHLLPGNPILVRVVAMGGKRPTHMVARLVYLLALFGVLLLVGPGLFQGGQGTSLAELAKSSTVMFMWVSFVQLALMCFIAPIFCAGAITQEKDANTFHILLTTPLSNAQIVLGTLLSRLFFVWALLLAGLPIFCITMIYGGVTTGEIFQSFGLAACTGLVTGSLAIMIGFLRIGARRAMFAFFAGIAVYLLSVAAVGQSRWGQLPEAPPGAAVFDRMSWLAPLHPFLALLVVTGQTPAPGAADVHRYGWPWGWLLAHPQYGYMLLTTLASGIMVILSLIFVRAAARQGERGWAAGAAALFRRVVGGAARRQPRRVWSNPVAWREAATRASAGGRFALRWLFILAGLALGVALLVAYYAGWIQPDPANPAATREAVTRNWLTVLVWIELAVTLLVVTSTAATTLTREKETRTIELLLCTPLTSRYIIAGMLRGLVSFAVPLVAVPTFTLSLFVGADLVTLRRLPEVVPPEAALLAPLLMVSYCALAAMVGLWFSMTFRKTTPAVMLSTAGVLAGAGLLWGCGAALGRGGAVIAGMVLPFAPFPAVQSLIDYRTALDPAGQAISLDLAIGRLVRAIISLLAAGAYLTLTYILYWGLVRSFDMTLRKQSA